MLARVPGATVMGDATGGSSGNPRLIELECGIVVRQPRWLDMDPEGKPLEHVGVAPAVELPATGFSAEHDPVIDAALARLRAIPADERVAGRRE
jgi:C-terminal processing protease CtpA/Prc